MRQSMYQWLLEDQRRSSKSALWRSSGGKSLPRNRRYRLVMAKFGKPNEAIFDFNQAGPALGQVQIAQLSHRDWYRNWGQTGKPLILSDRMPSSILPPTVASAASFNPVYG